MALDKLVDSSMLDGALANTADAIREKTGDFSSDILFDYNTITNSGFADAIGEIVTLEEGTANDTATSGDILSGKTAHVKGELVTGNIPTKTGTNLSASGKTVTVPAGYYAQQYTKDVATGSATTPATSITANPTITVGSDGLISATVSGSKSVTPTVSAGYVSSGTAGTVSVSGSATNQLSTLGATTYNVSTTADRTIASGTYLTGDQTISKLTTSGISAGNIKKGAVVKVGDSGSATRIHNVTGTFTSASTVSSGQTAAVAGDIKSGKSAWVDGVEVKGSLGNTSVTQGTTTVSGDTATRGTATWGSGVISSGEMGAATFANEATSGKTYVNISGTTDAPVLVAGDYLYINKGYTDDLKISLARLVPDGSDVKGHNEYILSGHSAYDNDGTLVAGSIPTLKATDVSVSGKTVTIPVGKYTGASGATAITKSVADGSVVPAVNSHSITTTPVVTGSVGGTVTDISSTTKPSGTDGTNYWTINPTGSVTTTGVSTTNAKATVTAGYIASSPANSSNSTVNITPTVTDGTKRYIAKGTATQNAPTVNSSGLVTATSTITAGYQGASTPSNTLQLSTQAGKTVTPTESEQTAVASGKYTTGAIKVGAISSTYVGSGIAQNDSDDLSISENVVTAPAGYYAENASATVPVGTVTSGTASITSVTVSDGSDTSKFALSGSANVSAPTVGTAGYISSSKGTRNAKSGGATLSATVNKIVGTASISATTKKPSITKQDVPSGVTQAASGDATTTAPSSGVYVAVKSAANTATLTPTVSITTSGYGTSSKHGITASGASVGAAASDTTYIPITTANPTFTAVTPTGGSTATGTNVTLSTTDNGMKVQTAFSINQASIFYSDTINGWVTKDSSDEAVKTSARPSTNGTAYYVTGVTMPKDKGFTVTTTADTALDTTSDLDVTNNAYRRVDITNKANGTVLIANSGNSTVTSGSATAGNLTVSAYNSSGTAENNKSIVSAGKWVATSVSGSGTYYGRVSVSAGSATTPATTITANPTISISSGGLITATTSATQSVTPTVSAGYVSSGTAGTITVSGTKTSQMTVKAATTWTPTTSNQTIATGTYLTGTQTIAGDANLKPENIRNGASIFGVTGTYVGVAPVITETGDSKGGTIVEITTDGEYSWRGLEVEYVKDITGFDVSLADTSYATWTPSTTATAIKATANSTTFVADFVNYEYIIDWKVWLDVVYNSGVTPKAAPKTCIFAIVNHLYKRPSTLANINANIYDTNISQSFTAPLQVYYTSSGVEALYYSSTYGLYAGATAATFSSATSNSPTVTPKMPTLNARCSSTYFATGMASNIDQVNSIFHCRGKVYKCKRGGFVRGHYAENIINLYKERSELL